MDSVSGIVQVNIKTKKMKKLFRTLVVSGLALLCFSCYYNEFPEEEEVVIDPTEEVSFANDILPIFAAYDCTQCHNAGGQSPNLSPDQAYSALVPAYVTAGNPNSSSLYTFLKDEEHRNVDAQSIAYIKKWIEDGAEDN